MSEISPNFFILSEILYKIWKNRPNFFIQKFNVRNLSLKFFEVNVSK